MLKAMSTREEWRLHKPIEIMVLLLLIMLPMSIAPAHAADNPATPPPQDLAPGLPAGHSARLISNQDLKTAGLGAAAIGVLLALLSGGHHSSTATATATSTSR